MSAFDWVLLILTLISQQCFPTEHKEGNSGPTVNGTYGWLGEVKWSEVKWSEVKWSEVKWSEVKWSEVKWSEGYVRIGVQYLWSNNIRN